MNRFRIMKNRRPRSRRGFTLAELIVAGMTAMLVIGAITISLFQSSRARETIKTRLVAYTRANSALDTLRREIASVMRRSDLFETRLLLYDDSVMTSEGEFDRDELLLFNTSLRPTRPNEYSGEGQEYETQFRIGEDRTGIILWQRRDAVPDEWSDAGGLAVPIATGVVGLKIEAYDGEAWYDEWDSDIDGLPWALRVTVTANGTGTGSGFFDNSGHEVSLRTQVAIDRIVPPPPPEEEEGEEDEDGEEGGDDMMEDGSEDIGGGSSGGGGRRPSGGGRPSGGRPSGGDYGGGRPKPGPGRGSRGNGTRPSGGGRGVGGGGGGGILIRPGGP